jgi:hypothetical protein
MGKHWSSHALPVSTMAHDIAMDMQLNDLESSPSTFEKASLGIGSIHASDTDAELVSDPNSVTRSYRLYKRRFAGTVGFVCSVF